MLFSDLTLPVNSSQRQMIFMVLPALTKIRPAPKGAKPKTDSNQFVRTYTLKFPSPKHIHRHNQDCGLKLTVELRLATLLIKIQMNQTVGGSFSKEMMRKIAEHFYDVWEIALQFNLTRKSAEEGFLYAEKNQVYILATYPLSSFPIHEVNFRAKYTKKVEELQSAYLEFLCRLAIYLQIGNQCPKEQITLDTSTRKSFQRCKMELKLLKDIFEEERQAALALAQSRKERGPTSQNLLRLKDKIVDVLRKYGKTYPFEKMMEDYTVQEEKCNAILKQSYQKRRDELEKQKDEEKDRASLLKLVTPFSVKEGQSVKYSQGGFGETNLVRCHYEVKVTTNETTMVAFQHLRNTIESKDNKILVKKIVGWKGADDKKGIDTQLCMKNEIYFLNTFKQEQCPYLANYFLRTSDEPMKDDTIYIQFYPTCLSELMRRKLDRRKKLTLCRQICKGLIKYVGLGVLHRDIKPSNIMIDFNGKCVIIDNGSWAPVFANSKYNSDNEVRLQEKRKALEDIIATTQDEDKIKECKHQIAVMEFYKWKLFTTDQYTLGFDNLVNKEQEKYQRNRYFDMSSFGTILMKMFNLDQPKKDYFRECLSYLAQKCRETNPDDRVSPISACIYLEKLNEYLVLQKQLWSVRDQCGNDIGDLIDNFQGLHTEQS